MKKAFLIAFLALSATVFAQSKYPTERLQENVHRWVNPKERTASSVQSELNLERVIKSQNLEQPSLYQEYDSIYFWVWDTIVGWKVGSRYINMVSDANHNLTYFIVQGLNAGVWVNFLQENKTYDSHNNLTNYLEKKWNVTDWGNNAKERLYL